MVNLKKEQDALDPPIPIPDFDEKLAFDKEQKLGHGTTLEDRISDADFTITNLKTDIGLSEVSTHY